MGAERGRWGLGVGVAVVGAALAVGAGSAGVGLGPLTAVAALTVAVCAVIVLRGQTAVDVATGVCYAMLALALVGAAIEVYRVAETLTADTPRIEYHGTVDPADLYPARSTGSSNERHAIRHGAAYPSGVTEATESVPNAGGGQTALYVAQELLPVLLAIGVLALLAPLLRAARRGRPFGPALTRRVIVMGWLLLVGVSAIGAVRFLLAYSISHLQFEGALVGEPTAFTTTSILPGLLVLGLAVVFRRGAEMQELEEHTV